MHQVGCRQVMSSIFRVLSVIEILGFMMYQMFWFDWKYQIGQLSSL